MANVVVKKSKIHELGVFASRNFEKGEIILEWDVSYELKKEQIDNLPEEEKRYVAFLEGKYILMQAPARYVNHSCSANTYMDNFCDVAKRDIKKGEEITANYSETMAPGEYMDCKCGNKNCRKIIKKLSVV
tara:strand:+ start:580 stop:972 length:393 start_codon:yes stop_codon:yes gene_type:complete